MNVNKTQNLINRLNKYPELCDRVDSILNIVENTAGNCTKADDAEQQTIDELRQLGTHLLQTWANKTAQESEEGSENQSVKMYRSGKKKSVGIPHSVKSQS